MKAIGIILLIFGFHFSAFSQNNPGYLGKHTIIEVEGTFNGSFYMKKIWLKYGGSVEFILSKSFAIGTSYLFNKSVFPSSEIYVGPGKLPMKIYVRTTNGTTLYKIPYKGASLITHQFSFDLYKYYDNIAPLGRFTRFSIFYIRNSTSNLLQYARLISIDPTNPTAPLSNQDKKLSFESNNFGFQFFLGRRRIINNLYVITYGIKVGAIAITPIQTIGLNAQFGFTSNFDFVMRVRGDNMASTFMALHLGIGILL